MDLSLVVPCFNEAENVENFYNCVAETFRDKGFSWECVFVDDGSRDGTLARLKSLPGRVQVVSFSRNFGKEAAMYAGLCHAKGERVCVIDADLQQHPSVVLEMMEILDQEPETDCVAAYQQKRKESPLLRALKAGFYKTINHISQVDFRPGASDFRLMRRAMVNAVLQMTEYHRFSKGIFSWVGFNTRYIPYQVRAREKGKSKWSLWGLFRYAMEGIVAFSTAPLKIATVTGFASSLAAIIYMIVVVIQKLTTGIEVPGYATIVVLILLLGGIQLMILGIIGEYLARIYTEGKRRPICIEKEFLDYED